MSALYIYKSQEASAGERSVREVLLIGLAGLPHARRASDFLIGHEAGELLDSHMHFVAEGPLHPHL